MSNANVSLKVYLQGDRLPLSAQVNVQPNGLYASAVTRETSQVILMRRGDRAQPVGRGPVKEEEATKPAALQTTLPMMGHSLATSSALNSPDGPQDTTQTPQDHRTNCASQPLHCIKHCHKSVCDLEMVDKKPQNISLFKQIALIWLFN